VSFKPGCELK